MTNNDEFAIHLFIKFRDDFIKEDQTIVNTYKEHLNILNTKGEVWWGNFGRRINDNMIGIFERQINRKIITYAYLHEKFGRKMYRGTINDITNHYPNDKELIPEYYRKTECKSYIKFKELKELNSNKNIRKIQNSVIYVYENGGKGLDFLCVLQNSRPIFENELE